jgi:hypothetical protein
MVEIGNECASQGAPGFILQYDEFHVVRERPRQFNLSALLAAVAAVQQRGTPIMLVLSGLPSLLENLVKAKSYSERMFTTQILTNLRPPEDAHALVEPALRRQRHFEPDVLDTILRDTAGYPYFIQRYGHTLWSGSSRRIIDVDDLQRMRPRVVDELDSDFFALRYEKASERERQILRAIAHVGESATIRDIQTQSRLPNHVAQPTIVSLVRKGLVYRPERGLVAFTTPLFGSFLRRRQGLVP